MSKKKITPAIGLIEQIRAWQNAKSRLLEEQTYEQLKGEMESRDNKKTSRNKSEISFVEMLTAPGKKILPKLIPLYNNGEKENFAYMITALKDLNLLNALSTNKTKLHRALTQVFGDIGTRQHLTKRLNDLERASEGERNIIAIHRAKIKSLK